MYTWCIVHITSIIILQAPNEPFNLEMALSIAKNHEHETILYTEQAETISVPVTSMPNSAEGFDGYQVIVMPSHEPILDPKPLVKYPSAPNEVSCSIIKILTEKLLQCQKFHILFIGKSALQQGFAKFLCKEICFTPRKQKTIGM